MIMKNSFIIFLSLIFSQILLAQSITKHIEIEWEQASIENAIFHPTLFFNGAKDMSNTGLIPYYSIDISLESNETVNQVFLTNIIENSQTVESSTFQNLTTELTKDYLVKFRIIDKGTNKVARISFPCLSKNSLPNVVNRLSSFDLKYEKETIENPTTKSVDNTFATESAMKDGKWFQFKLSQNGIYKISYEQTTSSGIDFSGFTSSNIKVYGFGAMLDESNATYKHPDIPEVAIKMIDGGDGSFDAGDYLLFYGEGPDNWTYDASNESFHHRLNIYARESFYYLVLSEGNGIRVTTQSNSSSANASVSTYTDYDFIEDETYNLINSGRRWFGDKYEFVKDYTYNFQFDNIVSGSSVYINSVFAARSTTPSRFTVKTLGETKSTSISAIPSGSYPSYAVGGDIEWSFSPSTTPSAISIDVNYNQPLSGSVGWLDYIEINVERKLIYNGNQLLFRNKDCIKEGQITEFKMQTEKANHMEIWDISNPVSPKNINFTSTSTTLSYKVPTDGLVEFIAYEPGTALQATFNKEIPNQNLHAEINHDYIIITHPLFIEQANELADFHRENSGLDVYVTTLEPIYHEFSSGRQDISGIRDFVRSAYENSLIDHQLKYLLLFGDASMDYLLREENNNNMVPTWESYESFNPIYSIATDDFFGFMDEWEGGDIINGEIDLGIGRFPVVSIAEAQDMVDKVKHYRSYSDEVMSDWRNTICFIADDEDGNLHIRDADRLSKLVDTIYPTANLDKIYADAYIQESTPAGQRYSKVNEAINERVDKGALIISYTGHGGEVGWGQERFLDMPDIESWTNQNRLPVFLTATCEFSRYDDPARVSAGERIFLNNKGGGISLFTTSRATFAGSNFIVSTNFYKAALQKQHGEYLRMGDILKSTKLASGSGVNVSKFVLLGDPALKISIPENYLQVNSIINNNTGSETDTIKALSNITIKGEVLDANDNLLSNYNGDIYPTIYDKPTPVSSLANDPGSSVFEFELQKNILYKGKADVVNGKFEFTFIVPKDIAYKYGEGKISLYAENNETDASGFDKEIIIGGFEENSTEDDDGPEIQLFINNINFVNGGITNENPILLAFVNDDNGINTTGNGIGHDITATLNNDGTNVKILNDYYLADANSYKSGAISFPFFNIPEGNHTIELKVWDIYNNSSKASIDFVVASSGSMALEQLFNYPNPVYDYTTFSFEHNQANGDMNVLIDIYSIDGKLVTRLEENFFTDSYRNNEIKWDVTDEMGNKISKGIYVYKVLVRSENGQEATKSNRLVVIK
ncbi:type IX secretion system sortase PorU [Lentimicrobium sp. S6]|uniref:type IX secretion system sortase PorU n=1 Tax=Lentimicrobium sp. S6 TaxID=2735872 RepID=UPI001554CD49|nr:type IX secretion system sortase PorU [Lentimicrobium sp. S6]NPD46387.1 type IX secretion system sortase PorU [Lentimicrobium sp. S6]